MSIRTFLLAISFIILYPAVSLAQFTGMSFGTETTVSLAQYPTFAEVGDVVSIVLETANILPRGATIAWEINGEPIASAANQRELQFPIPATPTDITATFTTIEGQTYTVKKTITPTRVDLLAEADTTVPAFYKGRALPSSGSVVRVTALPFIEATSDPSAYTYVWSVDNNTLPNQTGKGQNTVLVYPRYERAVSVAVAVYTADGTEVGRDKIVIPIVEPELYFYEVNPLRGINPIAIQDTFTIGIGEHTLLGAPFYFSNNLTRSNSEIQWRLNNRLVNETAENPFLITLNRQGDRGQFSLNLSVRNRVTPLQGAKDSLLIKY